MRLLFYEEWAECALLRDIWPYCHRTTCNSQPGKGAGLRVCQGQSSWLCYHGSYTTQLIRHPREDRLLSTKVSTKKLCSDHVRKLRAADPLSRCPREEPFPSQGGSSFLFLFFLDMKTWLSQRHVCFKNGRLWWREGRKEGEREGGNQRAVLFLKMTGRVPLPRVPDFLPACLPSFSPAHHY